MTDLAIALTRGYRYLPPLIALLLLTLPVLPAQGAHADTQQPVLVELFTSEGCSSCPPADVLLANLSQQQPVPEALIIPLAWHVDYWNHDGWEDPYSSPDSSQRQEQYAASLHADQIYTPQMVVDGATQLVGSDRAAATAAIVAAAHAPKGHADIHLTTADATTALATWRIADLQPDALHHPAKIILVIAEDDLQSQVSRGENSGRTLHHSAVVRTWQSLGNISAGSPPHLEGTTRIRLSPTWRRDHLKAILFVQQQPAGRIWATAVSSLRP